MGMLSFDSMKSFLSGEQSFKITHEQRKRVEQSYQFLKTFSKDKVIYGINTGFGPMAQYKIDDEQLNQLQYNLIRSHSNGTGKSLSVRDIKSLMICRLNTLALGKSAVSLGVLEQIEKYLEVGIYPEIPEHGSVGASGDLVQLAHLGLGLIGEGYCYFNGERARTADALSAAGLVPVQLQLRDGLALINGTSCMTGIAFNNIIDAEKLVDHAIFLSAALNEILESYDDSFSAFLNEAKKHQGQQRVAEMMREFLQDSGMIRRREDHLYNDSEEKKQKVFKRKVQEYYSIRCVPQIIGPILDTIQTAKKVVEEEVNSANDNPLTDVDGENVYHGGNFHGDYIAFEMDKVKIALTKLTMLMERQLNFLMNAKLNEIFPPFLNSGVLGLNFGLQGMQFTATSTTAECQTLANPMYIHSIPCNNDNQDIVSMGTNAANLTRAVATNSFQVQAILSIAVAQAIDILQCQDKISSKTKELYSFIRSWVNETKSDVPQFEVLGQLTVALQEKGF